MSEFKTQRYRLRPNHGREWITTKINLLPQDGDFDLIIKVHRDDRSLAQNNLMWWWLNKLSRHLYIENGLQQTSEQLKEAFTDRVWGVETYRDHFTGEIKTRSKSTSKAKVMPMIELLNEIDRYSASTGLLLPHPADRMYAAYGKNWQKLNSRVA